MPRANQLAPLLAAQATGPSIGFRQGTVLEWDPDSGANTIDIGGAQLLDVPILAAGGQITIIPGDAIGLLRVGHQYFIIGRSTAPNDLRATGQAGWMDGGSGVISQWYNTSSTTQVQLMAGILTRETANLAYWFSLHVDSNTTAQFQVTVSGIVVATTSISGGTSTGTSTDWSASVPYPTITPFFSTSSCELLANITSGSGKCYAALRTLYNN